MYVKQNNHLSNRRILCLTKELFAKHNTYILIVCQTKHYLTNRLSLCQTEYLFGKGVSLCQTKYLFVKETFCKAKIIVIAIQRETSPWHTNCLANKTYLFELIKYMTNSSALWFPLPHHKRHLLNLGSGELRWKRCRPSCGEGAGQRGGDESVLYTTAPAQRPSPPIYSFYTHRSACYTPTLPLTRSPGLPLHIRARSRAASARARRPLPSPIDWQRQPAVTALQSLPSPPPDEPGVPCGNMLFVSPNACVLPQKFISSANLKYFKQKYPLYFT